MSYREAIAQYPDPTPAMLEDPLFDAIWNAIKGWDISRHNNGVYSGPTGNDARHIYDAILSSRPPAEPVAQERIRGVAVRLVMAGFMASKHGLEDEIKTAERELLDFACDEITRHLARMAAPPATAPASTATGWLIEKDDPPVYAVLTDDYDEHWTSNASTALRFARREDALAYANHVGWTAPPVRAVEHMASAALRADKEPGQ
jgi:hypothetical protein